MQTAAVSARRSAEHDDLLGLLASPTLSPLTEGIRITFGPTGEHAGVVAPFSVPEPGALVVARSLLGSAAAIAHLRHGLELAWLAGEALAPPLAGLMAARTTALFLALQPPALRNRTRDEWLLALRPLAGDYPGPRQLAAAWDRLRPYRALPAAAFEPWMADRAAEYWPLAGPVEHLLASGGDARLRLDPETGLNRYGCAPWPRPGTTSFASCTASSVSERGYRAAEACRRRLLRRAFVHGAAAALTEEAAAIRAEILGYYGATELAEAILAPSGTDASLLLTGLLTAASPRERMTSILVSPTETGTGVPAAVRGQHFAECTARGLAVAKGSTVAGFPSDTGLETVALRGAHGAPLAAATLARDFADAIARATSAGRAVLHLVDSSKTGLSAPDFATAERLARRHAARLDLAVDACQARTDSERTRQCLGRGWPVLLTGSKFFGGPPFSGVILFPRRRLERILAAAVLPSGLGDYLTSDAARLQGLGDNPGLALRWAAALAEMRAFALVPPADAAALLRRLGAGVVAALDGDRHLHLVPGPRASGPHWSDQPTIFTIMARDPADAARWLSPAALGGLHTMLNRDATDLLSAGSARHLGRLAHHVGQPVLIGQSPAGPIGGLRIAFGARHVQRLAEAARPETAEARIMDELRACLAKLSLLLSELPELALPA